jgi:pyrroloquinoline quinone biosynthesis protein D
MTRPESERFEVSRHAALKTRAEGDILVLPERAIRLGGSGGEILRLCDPPRGRDAIVAEMQSRYPDTNEMGVVVDQFLAEMIELGGLSRIVFGSEAAPGRSE